MADDAPGQISRIGQTLFPDHEPLLFVFGEAADSQGFDAVLAARSTDSLEGISRDTQVAAARGLWPLFLVTWETIVPRDLTAREAMHFAPTGAEQYRFRVMFASEHVKDDVLVHGHVHSTANAAPGTLRRMQERRPDGSSVYWYPLRSGQRRVYLWVSRKPLTGTLPSA